MVLVIGGDGTLLRAAELARGAGVPLLGVNLGHVGFLAEAEPEDLSEAVDRVLARRVLGRGADDGRRHRPDQRRGARDHLGAERGERGEGGQGADARPGHRGGRPAAVAVGLRRRGVRHARPARPPTRSRRAGRWSGPRSRRCCMVPISAHALFAGPMVVSPRSVLAAEVIGAGGGLSETSGAVLWCDGRRRVDLPPGRPRRGPARHQAGAAGPAARRPGRVEAAAGRPGSGTAGTQVGAPFTDRLVEKFGLPVTGWRGRAPRAERAWPGRTLPAGRDEEPGGDA